MSSFMGSQKDSPSEVDEANYESFSDEEIDQVEHENVSKNISDDDLVEFEFYVPHQEVRKNKNSEIHTVKSMQRIVAVNGRHLSSAMSLLTKLFESERHTFFYVLATDSIVGQVTKELLEYIDEKLKTMDESDSVKVVLGLKTISCLLFNSNCPPASYINFLSDESHCMSVLIDPTKRKVLDHDFLMKEIIADIIFELFKKDSSGILWNKSFSKVYESECTSFDDMAVFASLGTELIPGHSFESLKAFLDKVRSMESLDSTPSTRLKLWEKAMHLYKLWITSCFRFPSLNHASEKVAHTYKPDLSVLEDSFVRTQLAHEFCPVPSGYILPSEYPLITHNSESSLSYIPPPVPRESYLTSGPFNDLLRSTLRDFKKESKEREFGVLAYQTSSQRARDFIFHRSEELDTPCDFYEGFDESPSRPVLRWCKENICDDDDDDSASNKRTDDSSSLPVLHWLEENDSHDIYDSASEIYYPNLTVKDFDSMKDSDSCFRDDVFLADVEMDETCAASEEVC